MLTILHCIKLQCSMCAECNSELKQKGQESLLEILWNVEIYSCISLYLSSNSKTVYKKVILCEILPFKTTFKTT